MSKKSVILGLVLLLAGAGLLGWVFTERKKEEQVQQEQQERFKANLSKVNEAVGDEIDLRKFDDFDYDENYLQKSDKYKKREETRGLILSISGVLTLTGGTILSWWLLLGSARLLIRGSTRATALLASSLRSRKEKEPERTPATDAGGNETTDARANEKKVDEPQEAYFARWKQSRENKRQKEQHQAGKNDKVLINSGWQNLDKKGANSQQAALSQTGPFKKTRASGEKRESKGGKEHLGSRSTKSAKRDTKAGSMASRKRQTAVTVPDEESRESEEHLKVKAKVGKSRSSAAGSGKSSAKLEDSLKAQTEDFERRVAEFGQTAGCLRTQQTVLDDAKPVEDSLKELTEQVSAIREYATHQQERVRRLQDGYDWNIIRNFCLRVIRCIDNLDDRIRRLSEQDIDTRDLEEIKDELTFALESTGVEQFEPEINTDYRGQEKNAEAVREKENCDDRKLKGKVAKIIRPGYQYFVDEENVKIVRPAQVKLFG